MGFLRKNGLLLFAVLFLLAGCSRKEPTPHPDTRVVTRIEVTCRNEDTTMERSYTDPQKIRFILNYLRLLKFCGAADTDPERITGDDNRIVLQLSDGHQRIYRQRAYRYLSVDCRPWFKVDPEHAATLLPYLQETASDS